MAIVDLIVVLAVFWVIASALALVGLAVLYIGQWRHEQDASSAEAPAVSTAVAG